MMIDDALLDSVKNEIRSFGVDHIRCAFFAGSCTYPFIRSPNDKDLLVFMKRTCPDDKLVYARPLKRKIKEIDPSISVIVRYDDYYTNDQAKLDVSDVHDARTAHCILPAGAFSTIFAVDVFGENRKVLPPGGIDILTTHRKQYLSNLKYMYDPDRYADMMKEYGRMKNLYYALAGIYFMQNGAYSLTEDQIRNVNIAHDCADGWEELYEWVLSYLKDLH
jgi:hypothetical protein